MGKSIFRIIMALIVGGLIFTGGYYYGFYQGFSAEFTFTDKTKEDTTSMPHREIIIETDPLVPWEEIESINSYNLDPH